MPKAFETAFRNPSLRAMDRTAGSPLGLAPIEKRDRSDETRIPDRNFS
jgi:hypothetical protein